MPVIHFFAKPGCGGNRRQQQVLRDAGAQLEIHDLLREPWTAESLRPFFAGKPVAEWFNRASPRIKSGEIDPAVFTESEALAAMLADPLLIRRPLIRYGNFLNSGFDWPALAASLDLQVESLPAQKDLETCLHPHDHGGRRCATHSGDA